MKAQIMADVVLIFVAFITSLLFLYQVCSIKTILELPMHELQILEWK
jgi:hypothetical protein